MSLAILLKKLLLYIPKNLAGTLGLVQAVIYAIREILAVVIRLLCPLLSFGPDGKSDERAIQQIVDIADRINRAIEFIKNKLLSAGE